MDPRERLDRRQYLALTGLAATGSIAGCSGDDDEADADSDPDPPADDDADDTAETTDDTDDTAPEEDDDSEPKEEDDDEEEEEAEPAAFEIVDIEHPTEVDVGEEHTIAITVENVGGKAGDFEEILELSIADTDVWEEVGPITIADVEAGATATEELDPFDFEDAVTVQFRLGEVTWEYDVLAVVADIEEQSFFGSGAEVRRDITIEGGLTVIEATHDGESNFQVTLEDDSDFGEHFINVIGQFDGAQANVVDAGEYILDVNADGDWEVTIRQPRAAEGDSLPVSISGNGPDVVGPIEFEGIGVAAGTHEGESNFQVRIYGTEDRFGETVFNDIGAFDGETSYSFDGIGWVDVNADGSWSLDLD